MKKNNDKQKLVNVLNEFGIEYKEFTDLEFIHTDALIAGSISSISVNNVDFNFNKDGKFVGMNTDAIKSFVSRRKK